MEKNRNVKYSYKGENSM